MRDLIKQIRHYNIIPSDSLKWLFLEQIETIFDENYFPMETTLWMQWNSSHSPQMHRKYRT